VSKPAESIILRDRLSHNLGQRLVKRLTSMSFGRAETLF